MNFFEPSHAIIGSELYKAFSTAPFQLGPATNHLYSLVDAALQRAGYQWVQDFEGVQGTGFTQKIVGGHRTITAETEDLVVVVLRCWHDRLIRSSELRSYLQGLVEDFVWLAMERGLAVREYNTSWKLTEPNAPLAQKENHHANSKKSSGPSTSGNDIEPVAIAKTRKTRASRSNCAKPEP